MTTPMFHFDTSSVRIKRGTIREDGKVFWSYSKRCINGEYWVRQETYDSLSKATASYYARNRTAIIAKSIQHRNDNPEYHREIERRYRERNRDRERRRLWLYVKENREKVRATKRAYRKRARLDPVKKLAESISARLRIAMTAMGFSKTSRTREYVGCDWDYLKLHIESLFSPNMTWDNHGIYGWHIDHIIPISSAKTEYDVRHLSHYSNLRPLWASENLSKHAKIIAA